MHMLVRQCIPPTRASQIRMTPCNRFETDPTKAKISFPPQTSPVIPSMTHKAAKPPKDFWASAPCDRSLTRFMPFTKPPGSQKKGVRYRVEEKMFLLFKPHVVLGRPIPQAVKAIRRHQERGRSRGCHHVEEKRLRRIPLQKSPIVHRRLSWFVIVQDKWKEVRKGGKNGKKKKRKYRGTKEMVGISVGCPKLYRLRALIPD